jgi:hypothetical protein
MRILDVNKITNKDKGAGRNAFPYSRRRYRMARYKHNEDITEEQEDQRNRP